jgi:hypothetical protein
MSASPTPTLLNSGHSTFDDAPTTENDTIISMSTTFYLGAMDDPYPADVLLLSSDNVYFCVHSMTLLLHSLNTFGGYLKEILQPILLSAHSAVINLALYALYDLNPSAFNPTTGLMAQALSFLIDHGILPKDCITSANPFCESIHKLGVQCPLETFTIMAYFDLEHLAIDVSRNLLDLPLHQITEEVALTIGPTYLRRLFFLHLGRIDRLKRLMFQVPEAHGQNKDCYDSEQRLLQLEWRSLAVALAPEATPAMGPSHLYKAFLPITQKKTLCPDCIEVSSRGYLFRITIYILLLLWCIYTNGPYFPVCEKATPYSHRRVDICQEYHLTS